jgi:NADPH2:quinone reductase
MMKAILFDDFGGADVLHLGDAPRPEIRPDDLLVKVMAAGVNRADILQREGVYGTRCYGDSTLLGLEIAGEVLATGSAVQGFALDSGMAAKIPDGLSFTQAAAIMESFVTGWEAVGHLGRVHTAETVLIHAAAGGIGSASVQLAKASGAHVLATAASTNIDNVLSIGADAVFDYRRSDFEADVIDATASHGVDLIVDFVGGAYLARNIRSLAPGGRLVQVGLLGREDNAIIPLDVVLHNHLQLIGTVMKSRSRTEKRQMVARFRDNVLPLLGKSVHPVIGAVYPLTQVADAHRRMETGGLFGKVVLEGFHP